MALSERRLRLKILVGAAALLGVVDVVYIHVALMPLLLAPKKPAALEAAFESALLIAPRSTGVIAPQGTGMIAPQNTGVIAPQSAAVIAASRTPASQTPTAPVVAPPSARSERPDGEAPSVSGLQERRESVPSVSPLYFAFDSAEPRPQDETHLIELASLMKARPELKVRLRGYTDPTGSPAYNLSLSRRRASAVAALLRAHGVEAARIWIEGVGAPRVNRARRAGTTGRGPQVRAMGRSHGST